VLEAYRAHVAERATQNIPPKPLDPEWTAGLVELLKNPPAGEEEFLLDLIANRVPPGVDEAAYVKAGFLSAIVNGEASSPLIDRSTAVSLLGNMHGGYNVATLVALLDDNELADQAAEELKSTLLVFDAFYDVAEKADAGNVQAKALKSLYLKPQERSIPTICRPPKTLGHDPISPCMPALCLK
jgi:aconitate hydratase 2/2-methylisocitrate dehydratase